MMAKNIIQKKTRIAHNKYAPDSLIVRPESRRLPFAAKIMKDTDSNLISNNLTSLADLAVNRKGINQKEYLEGTSHNQPPSTNIFKDKKILGLDKKFPLMEKSQKTMKHLEHNRKMPKPRAHLASLPQSPTRVDTKKSETRKKSSNSRKTASSPRESVTTSNLTTQKSVTTSSNVTSNTRDNVKKPESNRKKGNNSKKAAFYESVTNIASNTRDNVKKSESNRKKGNNLRKVALYESVTNKASNTRDNVKKSEANITSNTRDNVKKSESNRKTRNNSRKVALHESVRNKTSNTRDNTRKSDANRKENSSRKFLPYESVTTNLISSELKNSKESRLEERNKNKKVIDKTETVVAKKYFNKEDWSSDCDITDDIRNECSDSEASDSDFEKFVQTQRQESHLKKRSKKQTATGQKKTKQMSSIQKQKYLKRKAKEKSSSQYDSDSVVRRSKRRKVNNKSNKHESTDTESENNFSLRSKDESDSEGDDFYDNDVHTGDSSEDEKVLPNTLSTEPKSDKQPLKAEENSLKVKDNLVSNALSLSNPNINASSRYSSSDEGTILNSKDNESIESKPKNEQVLTEVKSLRVANDLSVNELSATHPYVIFNSISCAKKLVQESTESPMLIDLCLSDNECEPSHSIPLLTSTEKSEVKKAVIHNLPNTSNSQSDEESDLEIVDVVLAYEKLGKAGDNKRNSDVSTNEVNIKIEKGTSSELDKTENSPRKFRMQNSETILKHEAAFSTNICNKPAEADLNSTSVIKNNNGIINQAEIKKTSDDDDTTVLSNQTSSTTFPNPSQISPVASTNINTNVKHEIPASNRENPIENVANAAESAHSKEKLLYEIACYNVKSLIPDDKPTNFSSLTVDHIKNMDVTTLLQMFKTEFHTYQEIIETQESIGYTFKLLENRQAEKLLSLKAAIQKYIESFDCSGENSSNVVFPLEKTESSGSKFASK